ncbi:MAG: NAD(P)-dependent oxidoreductase [Gammaproteobacteria bacterium]|nr:NAD(P)-dependent oxidoreductase [Gammaproteobacteria bacterium]
MSRLVALTGASGFIGSALLRALSEDGWRVRALSRRPRKNSAAVEWLCGDLDDKDALAQLVKGVFAVIHCAGAVRGKSAAFFNHTNAEGTARLVEASVQQSPQPRLLLISSLAARAPQLSWYAASKRMAEQTVIERANAMPWTVFRPTAVYGPGDKELRPLLNAMRLGLLPAVGGSGIRFSLLHIKDLVAAIMCWISTTVPVRGVFELDDGTAGGYDWCSLGRIAEQVWQRPVRTISIPRFVLSIFANMNLYLSRLCRYEPMLTPGKVRELTHPDWICDNTPLLQALAWQPRVKLRDALQDTALLHA